MKWYEDNYWFEKSKIYKTLKEHFGKCEWRVVLKNGREYKSKNWDKELQKKRNDPYRHEPKFNYFNNTKPYKRK
jgi:hypothetical protein